MIPKAFAIPILTAPNILSSDVIAVIIRVATSKYLRIHFSSLIIFEHHLLLMSIHP